jgi:hypothetical protein
MPLTCGYITKWSYGDSNSGPLACHAMNLFNSIPGETPFFCIIAARGHRIDINWYRGMLSADTLSTVK